MEFVKFVYFLFLFFFLQSCGITTEREKLNLREDSEVKTGALSGIVSDLNGNSINLSTGTSRIQILQFVSETCSICRAETKKLVADRNSRGIPLNVDFLTIVVGAIAADAADWKNSLEVNWSVAIDNDDPLFRGYCPRLQTPCLVLRNPFLNQYKILTGEHLVSELETFTGAWVY